MSSLQPEAAGLSSGRNVVSETGNAAQKQQPGMQRKRRDTQQSPLKVPDSNALVLQIVNQKSDDKEEMRKFLALPIDEKTTHATRMMAKFKKELGEVEEKMKNAKQMKSRKVLPIQTPGRRELKMAMMKRENIMGDIKHELYSVERHKAVLELSLMRKKEENSNMDDIIVTEERQLKKLEKIIERDNLKFEAFLRENEKKSVEARAFFEREAKFKQVTNTELKKLTAEIGTIKSEIIKFEEILIDYKRYKELLFKLSPSEWQEAQKTKATETEIPSEREGREGQEIDEESGLESDLGLELPSIKETGQSSAVSDTKITKLESDDSDYEEEPQLYFTDPQQLLDLMTEQTEQNLSLIENTARVEETLEELQQNMETTRKKIESDEEQIDLQIIDVNRRIEAERLRGAKLKQKIHLHHALGEENQDVMLDELGEKVAEVYRCCVDDRITNLSTLEKLACIEKNMSLLMQDLESIPAESLEMMKKIKESERRTRQREEKVREQREKQQEKMRKYLERSLADSKKMTGRKLMPRSMPVSQKVRVRKEDNSPEEDDFYAYLFTPDDTD